MRGRKKKTPTSSTPIKKNTRRTQKEIEAGLTLEQKKKGITIEDIQAKNSKKIVEEKSKRAQFQIGGKAIRVANDSFRGMIFEIVDIYGFDEDGNPNMLILRKHSNPEKTFDAGANNYKPYNETERKGE